MAVYRFFLSIILIVSLLFSLGCVTKNDNLLQNGEPNDPLAWKSQGDTYYSNKQFLNALQCYEQSIDLYNKEELNFDFAVTLWAKARTLNSLGRFKEAEQTWNELHNSGYYLGNSGFDESYTYLNTGEYNKSLEILGPLSEREPRNIFVWQNIAYCYWKQENYEKATIAIDRALSVDPKNIELLTNKGAILDDSGDHTDAIELYNYSLECHPECNAKSCNEPKCAFIFYNRGNSYRVQGMLIEAMSDYNRAFEINPNDPSIKKARKNTQYLL